MASSVDANGNEVSGPGLLACTQSSSEDTDQQQLPQNLANRYSPTNNNDATIENDSGALLSASLHQRLALLRQQLDPPKVVLDPSSESVTLEIAELICGWLQQHKLHTTLQTLQDELGLQQRRQIRGRKDLRALRRLIAQGDWPNILVFLKPSETYAITAAAAAAISQKKPLSLDSENEENEPVDTAPQQNSYSVNPILSPHILFAIYRQYLLELINLCGQASSSSSSAFSGNSTTQQRSAGGTTTASGIIIDKGSGEVPTGRNNNTMGPSSLDQLQLMTKLDQGGNGATAGLLYQQRAFEVYLSHLKPLERYVPESALQQLLIVCTCRNVHADAASKFPKEFSGWSVERGREELIDLLTPSHVEGAREAPYSHTMGVMGSSVRNSSNTVFPLKGKQPTKTTTGKSPSTPLPLSTAFAFAPRAGATLHQLLEDAMTLQLHYQSDAWLNCAEESGMLQELKAKQQQPVESADTKKTEPRPGSCCSSRHSFPRVKSQARTQQVLREGRRTPTRMYQVNTILADLDLQLPPVQAYLSLRLGCVPAQSKASGMNVSVTSFSLLPKVDEGLEFSGGGEKSSLLVIAGYSNGAIYAYDALSSNFNVTNAPSSSLKPTNSVLPLDQTVRSDDVEGATAAVRSYVATPSSTVPPIPSTSPPQALPSLSAMVACVAQSQLLGQHRTEIISVDSSVVFWTSAKDDGPCSAFPTSSATTRSLAVVSCSRDEVFLYLKRAPSTPSDNSCEVGGSSGTVLEHTVTLNGFSSDIVQCRLLSPCSPTPTGCSVLILAFLSGEIHVFDVGVLLLKQMTMSAPQGRGSGSPPRSPQSAVEPPRYHPHAALLQSFVPCSASSITALCVATSGMRLFTGHTNGLVRISDVVEGVVVCTLDPRSCPIPSAPRELHSAHRSAGDENYLRYERGGSDPSVGSVLSVALAPNSVLLAVLHECSAVRLWDVIALKLLPIQLLLTPSSAVPSVLDATPSGLPSPTSRSMEPQRDYNHLPSPTTTTTTAAAVAAFYRSNMNGNTSAGSYPTMTNDVLTGTLLFGGTHGQFILGGTLHGTIYAWSLDAAMYRRTQPQEEFDFHHLDFPSASLNYERPTTDLAPSHKGWVRVQPCGILSTKHSRHRGPIIGFQFLRRATIGKRSRQQLLPPLLPHSQGPTNDDECVLDGGAGGNWLISVSQSGMCCISNA